MTIKDWPQEIVDKPLYDRQCPNCGNRLFMAVSAWRLQESDNPIVSLRCEKGCPTEPRQGVPKFHLMTRTELWYTIYRELLGPECSQWAVGIEVKKIANRVNVDTAAINIMQEIMTEARRIKEQFNAP